MTTRASEPLETRGWWTWWIVVWFLVYVWALVAGIWNTYHGAYKSDSVAIADTFELNRAEAWVSLGVTLISVVLLLYSWRRDTTAEYLDATRETRVILSLLLPALVVYAIVFGDDAAAKDVLHSSFDIGGWVLLGGLVVGRLDVFAKRRVGRPPAAEVPEPQPVESSRATTAESPASAGASTSAVPSPLLGDPSRPPLGTSWAWTVIIAGGALLLAIIDRIVSDTVPRVNLRTKERPPELTNLNVEGWDRYVGDGCTDPNTVFDIVHPGGERLGAMIHGTRYPAASRIANRRQLTLWQHRVDSALENLAMNTSINLGVYTGALTGACFALVGLATAWKPDWKTSGPLVTALLEFIFLSLALLFVPALERRCDKKEESHLLQVRAAYALRELELQEKHS